MDAVVVTVIGGDGHERGVAAGQEIRFGRDAGPAGVVVQGAGVSRHHGTVHALDDGWAVSATGSRCGVVVYDHETPSRLQIARGVGPVRVPFGRASIVIEARERHAIGVVGPSAPGWSGSRASVLAEPGVAAGGTIGAWDGVRWQDPRTGRPLRWYQTLVAMCEPFFDDPPVEAVPADAALAARLGTTVNVLQSRLIGEVRVALGFDAYTPQLRQTIVAVALAQQLVTAADLAVLDPPGP